MRIYYAALLIGLAAVPSRAGRPLATEDAYGVGARGLEAEFGFDYVTVDDAGKEYGPTVVGTYGVLRFLDVAAEVRFPVVEPEEGDGTSGLGDVALRAKVVAFGNEEAGPSLAFVPEVKLATGDSEKELGCGTNDFGGLAAFSYAAGPVTVHANAGYAYAVPDEGNGEGTAYGACAVEFAAFGPASLAAEFLADLAQDETAVGEGKFPMAAGGGLSFDALDNLALDAGAHAGLGAADGEFCATAGVTWGIF
ncbi:MAG TPA: transporter [bacterium]|nr:transporter [bacterium]